jgi:hypothetical protein
MKITVVSVIVLAVFIVVAEVGALVWGIIMPRINR